MMLSVSIWLCALAASLATGAFLAAQLLLGWRSPRLVLVTTLVLSLSYCLLAAEFARSLPGAETGWALLAGLGLVTLTVLAVVLQFWLAKRLALSTGRWNRAGAAGLLACLLAVAAAAGWRFEHSLGISGGACLRGSMDVEPLHGEALLTDRGRLVTVYRAKVDGSFLTHSEYPQGTYNNQRIEQAPEDLQSNCHGWVFAGGRYLLTGDGVEMILADNNYRTVAAPQPGDVVIYRDRSKQIVHTGLVRLVLDNGTVIVESKWGIGGRYLHKPEDQFYTPAFAYYRKYGVKHLASDVPHLVQSVRVPPDKMAPVDPATAVARQSQPADPPGFDEQTTLGEETGFPMPIGAEYPLGAE
jgi:hypothetical protein